MASKHLNIVFFGTPDFAVPSLQTLVGAGYKISAVVTPPDRPSGRGRKLLESPVKKFAVSNSLPVLQPKNLKSEEFVEDLRQLGANLQIVVAFRMLPEVVWAMPELGTFNLHSSLLPQYRGAAPINWAIINGETETGVTTFFLKHQIDTGNIILQDKEPIKAEDDAGTLHDRLMVKGANLVLETVRQIEADEVIETPQTEGLELKLAPKIFRKDCEIDWSMNADDIVNKVRGLCPYPGAWSEIVPGMGPIKVFKVEKDTPLRMGARTFDSDQRTYLSVTSGDGYRINITELQAEGKKRMNVTDFLRGTKLDFN